MFHENVAEQYQECHWGRRGKGIGYYVTKNVKTRSYILEVRLRLTFVVMMAE